MGFGYYFFFCLFVCLFLEGLMEVFGNLAVGFVVADTCNVSYRRLRWFNGNVLAPLVLFFLIALEVDLPYLGRYSSEQSGLCSWVRGGDCEGLTAAGYVGRY